MKTKHLFLTLLTTLLLMSCGGSKQFKVEGILSPELDGELIYLYDYYQSTMIDSTEVTNGAFVFEGEVKTTYFGLLVSQFGLQFPVFIEPGCDLIIDFNEDGLMQSSPMNDSFMEFIECSNLLMEDYVVMQDSIQQLLLNGTITEEEARKILLEEETFINNETKKNMLQTLSEHNNDALGLLIFESYLSMEPETAEIDSVVATLGDEIIKNPMIEDILQSQQVMAATNEGTMFQDFSVEQPDGTTVSLSDYVGKGRYVLVDFWASWCGPCRKAIPNIIELYNEYNSKGLDVLGVAVSDKVEASLKAIEEENIPWPQILNAQDIPGRVYGFSGIPHLILFAPDGTIVTRGTAGDELYATIREIMNNNQ